MCKVRLISTSGQESDTRFGHSSDSTPDFLLKEEM